MNIIITAGGTEEPIDSVRKITNMSTGKLGTVICEQFTSVWDSDYESTNKIFYICNKHSNLPKHSSHTQLILTTDMQSVKDTMDKLLTEHKIDYVVHSMAVSDYKFESAYTENMDLIDTSTKMQSNNDVVFLKLTKTVKIIDSIKKIQPSTKLISFKLRDSISAEKLISIGQDQLKRTNSSLVIANDVSLIRKGNHIAHAITTDKVTSLGSKREIAKFIYSYALKRSNK